MTKAWKRGGEIADELLNDVFHGQEAEDFAIFIDDKANALAVFLKKGELRKNRGAWRDVIGGLQLLQKGRFVKIGVAKIGEQAANRQYADQLIQRFPADRKSAVMACGELGMNLVPFLVEIENLNVAAGRHDVLDGDVVELKQARKNCMVFLGHQV